VDFTREPIIETVITPTEGCKLVVRSSKSTGQEEYFVDALEVVTFGHALFYRSLERPKAFLVPASDYEILEVREARMVLKNVGIERTIKIGGGKAPKEQAYEKPEAVPQPEPVAPAAAEAAEAPAEAKVDGRVDKRRERRRHARRRRGRDDGAPEESDGSQASDKESTGGPLEEGESVKDGAEPERAASQPTSFISPLLPPPSTLISETIARYRDNALFREAFYSKEEASEDVGEESLKPEEQTVESAQTQHEQHEDLLEEALDMRSVSLEPSEFGSFGTMQDENDFIPLKEEETPIPPAEPSTPAKE
jgi:hypothetical protein